MITLFHYVDGINGSLVSIIDYYEMMNKLGYDVNLCLVTDKNIIHKSINTIYKSYNLQRYLNDIQLKEIIKDDILICSSAFFFKNHNIQLSYDKLIILDSLELSKCNLFDIPTEPILPKDGIYLCNPSTMIHGYDCREYYHKIDFTRKTQLNDIFLYDRLLKDNIQVSDDIYIENIGKKVFEHLYHDKKVDYRCNGKYKNDGLTYYLNKIGINDNINQIISNINVDCFKFNKDDLILKIVR